MEATDRFIPCPTCEGRGEIEDTCWHVCCGFAKLAPHISIAAMIRV